MNSQLYYSHSGRISIVGLVAGIAIGSAIAAAVGAAYTILSEVIPLIYVDLVLTAGFGALVGWIGAQVLMACRVRSNTMLVLGTAVISVAGLYGSWCAWVVYQLHGYAQVHITRLVARPDVVWGFAKMAQPEVNWTIGHAGSSSSGSPDIAGWMVWVVWGVEAIAVLALAQWAGRRASRRAFCEECAKWCKVEKQRLELPAGDPADLQRRLEIKDFTCLTNMDQAGPGNAMWQFDSQSCNCGKTNVLNVQRVETVKHGRKTQTVRKDLIRNLLLDLSQHLAYRETCEAVRAKRAQLAAEQVTSANAAQATGVPQSKA
jgi:hypothetical protein